MALYFPFQPLRRRINSAGIVFSLIIFCSQGYAQQATLDWFTYFGGSEQDVVTAVEKFPDDGFVSFGYTRSPDNIAFGNAHQADFLGVYNEFMLMDEPNAFITRWSSSGTPVWSTYYGGEYYTEITGAAVLNNGNIAVTGHTYSGTNIATPGAFIEDINQGGEFPPFKSFLSLFSPSGELLWGTYFGTGNKTRTFCLAADDSGNIYIGGQSGDSDIATEDAWQTTLGGSLGSGFVAKFNSTGMQEWCTYIGTAAIDIVMQIEIDNDQNLVVAGATASQTGIASDGADLEMGMGSRSLFLASFTSDGQRNWSTYVSSNTQELQIVELALDELGGIYIAGVTTGDSGIGTPEAFQENYPDNNADKAAFLCKYSISGVKLWGSYVHLHQLFTNQPSEIYLGLEDNHLYFSFVAASQGDGTPYGSNPFQTNLAGGSDNYIFLFNTDGFPIGSSFFGGNFDERNGLVIPLSSTKYVVAGTTYSSDFYATETSWQNTITGIFDSYFGIMTDLALGINSPVAGNKRFKIFPNPGTGSFRIEWPEGINGNSADLRISSLSGVEILRISNHAKNDAVTHNLPQGFYLVTLESDGSKFISKLVVAGS